MTDRQICKASFDSHIRQTRKTGNCKQSFWPSRKKNSKNQNNKCDSQSQKGNAILVKIKKNINSLKNGGGSEKERKNEKKGQMSGNTKEIWMNEFYRCEYHSIQSLIAEVLNEFVVAQFRSFPSSCVQLTLRRSSLLDTCKPLTSLVLYSSPSWGFCMIWKSWLDNSCKVSKLIPSKVLWA